MLARFALPSLLAVGLLLSACATSPTTAMPPDAMADGVVKVKSVYAKDETIARLKQDIAGKGIRFFAEIDQAKLAADAGISLRPSTLLLFGNPPLGTQFMTSNPLAGLDWPVRLLVIEDEQGQVWAAYTEFSHIAKRNHISDRAAQFKMASEVVASITSSIMK
jgi:uncharacterized protein (DUF302 family)